ncbi:unnamed protein product [Malus baccata var. baccata]
MCEAFENLWLSSIDEAFVVEALELKLLLEFRSPSDWGSPNSNSRFELAMLESSGPLLESCTKNSRLGDLRNCQALANIGSSSFMSVGEGVVCDAIPIFRSEFTAGEPSFHQWCYCYKMRPVKACTVTRGTIKLSGRELADVEKVLRVPKEDRHLGKLRPLFRKYGFQPLVSECQRRAMEKVGKKGETNAKKGKTPMLVPVYDILFHKGARKHRERPTPKPKLQKEVLKIATSKKAEAETIEYATAIVVGEEGGPSCSRKRKYKEEVGSIHWKDLKVAMQPSSFRYVNNCLAGRRSTVDELGEPLDENESNCDRMIRLSSYVMTEYDDILLEVERYKVKFKENKQFVNDTRKTSKALADAIRLKDENFKSLKRRNGENVRLKKQLEATKEQLETTILEVSKVSGLKMSIPTERDAAVQEFLGSQAFHDAFRPHCIRAANFEKRKWMAYRDEMDEYRQKGEAFVLAVDPSSDNDSDNKASINEQSHESEDDPGDAEEGGDGDGVETQSDSVRGSASDEDDSVPWMAKDLAIGTSKLVEARTTDANNFKRFIPVWTKYSSLGTLSQSNLFFNTQSPTLKEQGLTLES